jgi:hypothetical protein
MLIDEIIYEMERFEERLKRKGYKDPEGCMRSLLYRISTLNKNKKYQLIIFLLEKKIHNYILLVRRLRKELSQPIFEKPFETKNLRYVEIDIEAFLNMTYSLLNIIARLTPSFYEHPARTRVPCKSFNKQRKWYIGNVDLDPKYSEFFKNNTSWFEEFREHRKHLTHYHPLVTFRSSKGSVFFGTKRDEKGFIPNFDVSKFINLTANNVLEFLEFYDNYFGSKIEVM